MGWGVGHCFGMVFWRLVLYLTIWDKMERGVGVKRVSRGTRRNPSYLTTEYTECRSTPTGSLIYRDDGKKGACRIGGWNDNQKCNQNQPENFNISTRVKIEVSLLLQFQQSQSFSTHTSSIELIEMRSK